MVSYKPEMGEGENDTLKIAGEALYGPQWQTPLSRDLGVTDRTVRNWVAGCARPADLTDRILPLLRHRAGKLEQIIMLLEHRNNGAS